MSWWSPKAKAPGLGLSGARKSHPLCRMELPGSDHRLSPDFFKPPWAVDHWRLSVLPCSVAACFALFWAGPPKMNSAVFISLSILPNMAMVFVRSLQCQSCGKNFSERPCFTNRIFGFDHYDHSKQHWNGSAQISAEAVHQGFCQVFSCFSG